MSDLPYRPNVGAVLFNEQGEVFIARRAPQPGRPETGAGAWQLPQGGMDEGEAPRTAVLRELAEEIGTDKVEIIAELEEWLHYDLPPELIGKAFGGKYRGQKQRWFALRFTGQEADIRLDLHEPAEFDAWRWAPIEEIPSIAVGFKKPIYERVAKVFAPVADMF